MTTHNPAYDFRHLKQEVGIGRVLAAYGLHQKLRRRGQQLCGPCPLHKGDNNTAFRVHLGRNTWRCFTHCGGGDTVELVRRIERCSYAEAARHLRRLMTTCDPTPLPSCFLEPSPLAKASFRPFVRRIPLDPKVPFLQEVKGISVVTAQRFEAGCTDRSLLLRGTVALRLHDLQGRPLGYCGRRLDSVEIQRWGKWRFSRGFPKARVLYNAHRALPFRRLGVVVVEGSWSVMRLSQAGIHSTVALLGTQLSPTHLQWLAEAPAVLLLLDGDEAGRTAAQRIAAALASVTKVSTVALPDGHEPEDLTDQELRLLLRTSPFFSLNQYSFGLSATETT